jgi:hypothetical protein
MTKPLSPAAQAVLDAAMASAVQNLHGTYERDIAAAIRAAVDQVVPQRCFVPDFEKTLEGLIRTELLAIADELEAP